MLVLLFLFSECAVCFGTVVHWGGSDSLPLNSHFGHALTTSCSGSLSPSLIYPCFIHTLPQREAEWLLSPDGDFPFVLCDHTVLPAALNHWDSMLTQPSCCISSPPCNSRLCTELPVVEENDVPQDSLDECHLTSSIGHHLPDTWRPCTSASSTRDKEETFEGLDVDGK